MLTQLSPELKYNRSMDPEHRAGSAGVLLPATQEKHPSHLAVGTPGCRDSCVQLMPPCLVHRTLCPVTAEVQLGAVWWADCCLIHPAHVKSARDMV